MLIFLEFGDSPLHYLYFQYVVTVLKTCPLWPNVLSVRLESQGSLVWFLGETYIFILNFPLFSFPLARGSPCKWNQAWLFSSSCCYRPQIRLILRGLCISITAEYGSFIVDSQYVFPIPIKLNQWRLWSFLVHVVCINERFIWKHSWND